MALLITTDPASDLDKNIVVLSLRGSLENETDANLLCGQLKELRHKNPDFHILIDMQNVPKLTARGVGALTSGFLHRGDGAYYVFNLQKNPHHILRMTKNYDLYGLDSEKEEVLKNVKAMAERPQKKVTLFAVQSPAA